MSEPVSEAERRRLERQLGEKLPQDCDECESVGYSPRQFRIMLAESGPVGACVRVIVTPRIPDGFLTLVELNKLELTTEAVVLRWPWRRLFENEVLEEARKRLRKYDRPDLAIP